MLKNSFTAILSRYGLSHSTIKNLWQEIAQRHGEAHRHYHNLSHLIHLMDLLQEVKQDLAKPNAVYLALFYHDVVYEPQLQDNEEQSARLAKERLSKTKVPHAIVNVCVEAILATKKHAAHTNKDINYLTDADLGILGSEWPEYLTYTKKIRQEYQAYDDDTYRKGRKKVLEHFLEIPRIYKSEYFYQKLEHHSKENLEKELLLL